MESFGEAAGPIQKAAGTMSGVVSLTQERVHGTAAACSETSENLSAVAADAVREAEESDGRMRALTGSVDRIGNVLGLISDVAARTNLLALNATIEPARAGEAGKGFAVVASEVKALAAQTARATEDIGAQIHAMRQSAAQAADAKRGIADPITRADDSTTAIAAAVEQQSAATREITSRLQSVAIATQGVSRTMEAVSEKAQQAGRISGDVQSGAEQVQAQAARLRAEVDRFLANLNSSDDERRRSGRRGGQGRMARLLLDGREERAVIRDISLGGAALDTRLHLPAGTAVHLGLSKAGACDIPGRVVRSGGGSLALILTEMQSCARMEALLTAFPDAA